MSEPQSIIVITRQGCLLRLTYTPAWDSIDASLHQRPSKADRKVAGEWARGQRLVFVAADRGLRLRLSATDDTLQSWMVWIGGTGFEIGKATHVQLLEWIAATFPAIDGGTPR